MGDPKFQKKLYSTPRHPWEKVRIDAEREIINKYGLKNKRELWKSETFLKSIRAQARDLQAKIRRNDENAIKQLNLLVNRLNRYKIVSGNPTLDDILSLSIENVLERRLQTVVFRKNMAVTIKQARQLIVHGHIKIGDTRVTIPSYMVEEKDEENITYTEKSPLSDEKHPVRILLEGKEQKEEEAEVVE
ncbi:30S ribosomal protein S4 [Caldiplasma sukawensis]